MPNNDPDTTPLRRLSKLPEDAKLAPVETNDLSEHYKIASQFYGDRQYADLSLLLKRNVLK